MVFIVDILSGALIPVISALGIGLMASIAPCALTSNIAALAYVSERLSSPWRTALSGLSYLAGRALVFGIGTGLPVLAFTLFAALGVSRASEYVDKVRKVEPLIRKLFGAGLVIYGFYLVFLLIM